VECVDRRAGRVLDVDTSTYQYRSRWHDQPGLEARTKEISATRIRYGYRRVHVLLRQEGWKVSAEVYRIHHELERVIDFSTRICWGYEKDVLF
jgi:putative transposase